MTSNPLLWRAACAALFVTAAALAGCNTLPVITPDMAPAQIDSVRLQAANGHILSAQRSRAILAGLAKGGGTTPDAFARHLALEEAGAEAPLTTGNRVVLLEDGPSTYQAMFAAIAAARERIDMETYIMEEDAVGLQFADALIARQREGVRVHLIHDGVGTLGTSAAYFKRLSSAGVQVVEFNPVNPLAAQSGWDVNQRDHRKILVTDGKLAIIGGINISSVYSGGSSVSRPTPSAGSKPGAKDLPWRDTDLQIEGPAVDELQRLFDETWAAQKGPALASVAAPASSANVGKEVVRVIGSKPEDPYSQIYVALVSAINSAETEILLTNAYFVPDPQLLQALVDAAGRGVRVKMIVPGTTDSSLVFHAGRAHYDPLLRGGVKLYERREALLHAKTAVIDGVWSTVGSTNLDWRSFLHNQEVTAVVLGAGFGDRMRAAFEHDLAVSDEITLQVWESRSLATRVKEAFARLWEYWL
ncbi:MAG: phospholipase D-like domain-containing protein [Caldimonas sp.]